MCCEGASDLDLWQASLEIAVALKDALEGFPGPARDCVRVAIRLFAWNRCRDARVARLHGCPVVKVPSLQFLNGNTIDLLPIGASAIGPKPAIVGNPIEAGFQDMAVVIVAVDNDQNAPVSQSGGSQWA